VETIEEIDTLHYHRLLVISTVSPLWSSITQAPRLLRPQTG
jgi:hypothetical protein